jgi:hypothetical protein
LFGPLFVDQINFASFPPKSLSNKLSDETGNTNLAEAEHPEQTDNEASDLTTLNENRDLFRQIWRKYDSDCSDSLSRDELKLLINDIYSHVQKQEGIESSTTTQPTDRELERDLYALIKIMDRAQDHIIGRDEFESFLFPELYLPTSTKSKRGLHAMDGSHPPVEQLMGVVRYDDLQEFSSTVESYRITGTKEKENFPPVPTWRRGKGIRLFWELYERETGCSEASLNGQDVVDVQTKLVRALCNYKFAKYCWKALVRPKLQEKSMRISGRRGDHQRPKRGRRKDEAAYHTVTDWVLDGNSGMNGGVTGESGLRASMHTWVRDQSESNAEKNDLDELSHSICR